MRGVNQFQNESCNFDVVMNAFLTLLLAINFSTENITVYDLKGVSRSQVTADTFEMIRVGNQVMSSFPETLHCLLIINAPGWFGFVWSVVKKLIDPRTASKIEVVSVYFWSLSYWLICKVY